MGNLSISRNKLCTAAKEHFFLSGEKYKILKVYRWIGLESELIIRQITMNALN
jgi:hypothetical protein